MLSLRSAARFPSSLPRPLGRVRPFSFSPISRSRSTGPFHPSLNGSVPRSLLQVRASSGAASCFLLLRSFSTLHTQNRSGKSSSGQIANSVMRSKSSNLSTATSAATARQQTSFLPQQRFYSGLPNPKFYAIPAWLVSALMKIIPRIIPLLGPLAASAVGIFLKSLPFIAVGFLMLYATYIIQTSQGIAHYVILSSLVAALVMYVLLSTIHYLTWIMSLEPKLLRYFRTEVEDPKHPITLATADPIVLSSFLALSPHSYQVKWSLKGNPEMEGKPRIWCTYRWEAVLNPNNKLRPHEELVGRFEAVYAWSWKRLFSRHTSGPLDKFLGGWHCQELRFAEINSDDVTNETKVREYIPMPLPK